MMVHGVCLDGTAPGYHLQPGHGSGANSWLVNLEGGGWCNDTSSCLLRKTTALGSSLYMEGEIDFTGILSNKSRKNPGFYNWNRVLVRYCDGASFAGEGYNKSSGLYFRGKRVWSAVMEDLMSKGMHSANKVLLSGCSAGGLATILHCDEFRLFFPRNTTVKCLADAALFLDAVDVAGRRGLRSFYDGVVNLQGVAKNLPRTCTSRMDAISCFFPQNLVDNIRTPTFLLNAAYDMWQFQVSLAPTSADPHGVWEDCKLDYMTCNSTQIKFLQGFRRQMVGVVGNFSKPKANGVFINSCFTHCQSVYQDTWHGDHSPSIAHKGIATSVGDWFFDRRGVKAIDCPYPCDTTCHNLVNTTLW